MTDLLRAESLSPRTSRERLGRERLPPPGRFHTAARVVRGHLWLQQDPMMEVQTAAWKLGYADSSGFGSASRRLFDVSPGDARGLLGLEWRFQAWWRQADRAVR